MNIYLPRKGTPDQCGNFEAAARVKRPMARPIFTSLAALSLLACVGVAALWARSHRFPPNQAGGDVLNISTRDPLSWVISANGRVTLCRQCGRDWGREIPGFDRAGFHFGGLRGPNGSLYNAAVPHAFLAAQFLVPPAAWAFSAWRRRRVRPGTCQSCDYDLTGNVSGVCPECGENVLTNACSTAAPAAAR